MGERGHEPAYVVAHAAVANCIVEDTPVDDPPVTCSDYSHWHDYGNNRSQIRFSRSITH
ncbi:protein of unknown function [Candidatus Filomicrobium marinum]|uniref:Uncharacterized protein n=1 Tax=Candidatus Filomicrobium marinum TaxID=1608628 RepID=A0A0D6JAC2_9HYPH|nr:protein of unknown function [Candidatus Filomicrobium marinum]CPR15307.1 protein of unknown function [Candidatus Filomicrobium marinum]